MTPTAADFRSVIDHTFLKTADLSHQQQQDLVKKTIDEATKFGAYAICIRPEWISFAKQQLDPIESISKPKICSVIGFPDGDVDSLEAKIKQLKKAREDGAEEFDIVIPVKALQNNQFDKVYHQVFSLSQAAHNQCLKVIFEMTVLTLSEKKLALELVRKALVDSLAEKKFQLPTRFLKTSTGFAPKNNQGVNGATLADIKLMHQTSNGAFGLKPSGGISTLEQAQDFFKACGSPICAKTGKIDPMRFRIGSSQLLLQL